MTKISISENVENRLMFINLLNQAGNDNKPVIYPTLFEARKNLSSMLIKIEKKLTDKEVRLLLDRIENVR